MVPTVELRAVETVYFENGVFLPCCKQVYLENGVFVPCCKQVVLAEMVRVTS